MLTLTPVEITSDGILKYRNISGNLLSSANILNLQTDFYDGHEKLFIFIDSLNKASKSSFEVAMSSIRD